MSYEDDVRRRGTNYPGLGKKIAAGVVAAGTLMVPIATFLTTEKTPADKVALSYGGGPFEGNQFQGITQPGSGLKFNGWFDKWYEYPTTVRNYIVSSAVDEGDKESFDVISTPDKDGVVENIELTISFKLTDDEEKLRDFHEKLGMKYEAWTEDGWKKMLGDNVRQPLNNSVVKILKGYTTDEIRTSPEVLAKIEAAIEKELPKSLESVMGADYFCGPTVGEDGTCSPIRVVVKSITPADKAITDSYNAQKESANGIITAQNKAQQKIETATGEKAAKDAVSEALTPEYLAYLEAQAKLECAKNDNCTLIISDGASPALTVPAIGR